jgi:hypothetical protein
LHDLQFEDHRLDCLTRCWPAVRPVAAAQKCRSDAIPRASLRYARRAK